VSRVVVCLLATALVIWGIALLRELCALVDYHECDRRLRRAGMPPWLTARGWWAVHAGLRTLLTLALVWSAAFGSRPATGALALLLAVAWRGPVLWLRWRIRRRRNAMRRTLPGALVRLRLATQCLAPFEEALQLTLRWGPDGPLEAIMQDQLLRETRWPRPRLHPPLTPLVAEMLDAARAARDGLIDREEQLQRWQWLLLRSHPAARPAYDPQRRHIGAPADAEHDAEVTSQ
jgi:hypothetical protein